MNKHTYRRPWRRSSLETHKAHVDCLSSRLCSFLFHLPLYVARLTVSYLNLDCASPDFKNVQSWLSTNNTTPMWVFVPIAIISIIVTTVILMTLKWNEQSGSRISNALNKLSGRRSGTNGIQELPMVSPENFGSYAKRETESAGQQS